jgi:uncharacterized protein
MAETILDELKLLVKKQARLQEKVNNSLLKAEKFAKYSRKEIKNEIKNMIKAMQHLPSKKQQELEKIVSIICQYPEVDMVILFGSYARGDWVEEYEEDGTHFKYQSDFDLLIVASKSCSATRQKTIEQAIFKVIDDSSIIHTPVSILVHDIGFINSQLKKEQYFFSDIKKEGITLYDSGNFKLEESIELDNKQRYQLAKEDFEYWFPSAKEFFINFQNAFDRKSYNIAAFELHQVTERLYTCILLVFTHYKPNTHKLELLRKLANALDKRLIRIFPLNTLIEIYYFKLLCEAYVDARYDKNYTITSDELSWILKKVQELTHLTEILCQEKIKSFLNNSVKPIDQ